MKKNKKNGIGKFVLGASIGALAGVLFAPKTGKETRRELKNKAVSLLNKAKELDVSEVKEEIEEKVINIMDEIKDLNKEKVLEIAKDKASKLKKNAEDLVSYAKDKATPVVSDAAEALRQKAVEVTKNILEKLES